MDLENGDSPVVMGKNEKYFLDENTPSNSFAPVLDEEKQGLSDKTKATIKKIALVIFLVCLVSYSIAAFVKDFKRAKALFWMEVVAIVCISFSYIKRSNIEGFSIMVSNVEDSVNSLFASTAVCVIFGLIMTGGVVAVVLACIWDDLGRLVSALGLFVFISLCYAFSWKRNYVKWRPVLWGFGLQFVLAVLILRTSPGYSAFNFIGEQMKALLDYTNDGSQFVFGYVAKSNTFLTGKNFTSVLSPNNRTSLVVDAVGNDVFLPGVFAFSVLPTIIFFSSFISILYYTGIMQAMIAVIGKSLAYIMGTSTSESVNAAGNIFVGQTEAPFLIKPFIADMTKSELHAVMTGGFATIAGGVLAIYISMGISASNLLAASVMSAPAALAISKIIYPETEESPSGLGKEYKIVLGHETNVIEAAANGASTGTVIAGQIAGMLIAFLALIAMLNAWVNYFGVLVDYEAASFTNLCAYIFAPCAWLMGVQWEDCHTVGELIALKIIANEFVAYEKFNKLKNAGKLLARSEIITTYALCGFSNLSSMGIQLAGLGNLAPRRRGDIAELVFSAMVAGNIACFMTACIAGLLFDPEQ